MATLKCSDVTIDVLLSVLRSISPPTDDRDRLRLWATAPDGWTFDFYRGLESPVLWYQAGREPLEHARTAEQVIRESLDGRLFAPSGELRWRLIPALSPHPVRTVFLGDQDWCSGLPGPSQSPEDLKLTRLPATADRSLEMILWGTREDDEEWLELQIPHRLRYPVAPGTGNYVHLQFETWVDKVGEPHFVRFRDLLLVG